MEDDNGLELSLGLSCGGSAGKLKGKAGTSDSKTDDERGSKIVSDFKDFLHAGTQKQDSGAGSQSDSAKPQENFFSDLSKATGDADTPVNLSVNGPLVADIYRPPETKGENRAEMANKRKMPFDEISHQTKHGRDANYVDVHDQSKTSHISITTEDGSAADNEDVADSEVEGSTSRLVQHHNDTSKRFSLDLAKDAHGFSDARSVELQGQKRFNGPSDNEFKHGNLPYGIPFSIQPMNMVNGSQSVHPRDSNNMTAPGTPGYAPPGIIQPVTSANLPMMFGYSPIQLPTMDKDNSLGLAPQQSHPLYAGKVPPSLASNQVSRTSPEVAQHARSEGSSTRTEEDARGAAEGFSLDFSAIKPGIAADVKFGGCGSYPNLPWVSTTGPGPNGKTISGVTYKYNANQIKIVCACHGTHMSAEEFVRHAAEDSVNADGGANSSTFPNNNPAASAQS